MPRVRDLESLMKGANDIAQSNLDSKAKQQQLTLASMLKRDEDSSKRDAEAQQLQNMYGANDLKGAVDEATDRGQSIKLGDTQVGQDPYSHLVGKQSQGDAQARAKAVQIYQQGLSKISPIGQAASEGLDAVNDPKNIGSLGQARTLMLKAMGMNRYNEQEAKAVLPSSLYSTASTLFNSATGDDNAPLNSSQRATINQFFKGQLENATNQHNMLKQNALNSYSTSPYANPSGAQALQVLGSPTDEYFKSAASKYKELPATAGPDLAPKPEQGPVDKLKAFFGMGGAAAPAAPNPLQDAAAQEIARRQKLKAGQ